MLTIRPTIAFYVANCQTKMRFGISSNSPADLFGAPGRRIMTNPTVQPRPAAVLAILLLVVGLRPASLLAQAEPADDPAGGAPRPQRTG